MTGLLLPAIASVGLAGSPDLTEAWFLLDRWENDRALAAVAEVLRDHPQDVEAHRLNAVGRSRSWGGDRDSVAMYRRWLEDEPSVAARFGLAAALSVVRQTTAEECEEMESLLQGLPEETTVQYQALRVRIQAARDCDLDVDELQGRIVDLGITDDSGAWSYGVLVQAKRGIDATVIGAVDRMVEEQPSRLVSVYRVAEEAKGADARQLRKALIAAVDVLEAKADVASLYYGARLLEASGDQEAADAMMERAEELDPPTPGQEWPDSDPMIGEIYDANRRPTHALGLEGLDALAADIPETGEVRATWQGLRHERLSALGQDAEAYQALLDAARAVPDDMQVVNSWAYEAAVRGEDLDAALQALEAAWPEVWEPQPEIDDDYDRWASRSRSGLAAWEDTRAWLLHGLERDDEALTAMYRALALHSDGVMHGHVANILLALDREQEAYQHLLYATRDGVSEEALAAEVASELDRLHVAWGLWHPEGLEGVVADLSTDEEDEEDDGPGQPHPLLGKQLPLTTASRLDGPDLTLSNPDGLLVIDLWATWCGPCVAGMPHLQEVAETYADRGVKVVGLSVDSNEKAVRKFFKGAQAPAYDLGYLGPSGMQTMRVSGIPALFVVRGDGVIETYISGYGDGDDRLERALDELLEQG